MKAKETLLFVIGAATLALALFVGIVALLYWLTGLAGDVGARVWAVVATLALPFTVFVTYRLATHAAREHLAGLDRGLSHAAKSVETMGRSLSATASLARSARSARIVQPDNSDLLPKVGTMRLIESQQDTNELIDL